LQQVVNDVVMLLRRGSIKYLDLIGKDQVAKKKKGNVLFTNKQTLNSFNWLFLCNQEQGPSEIMQGITKTKSRKVTVVETVIFLFFKQA
jgi:hypothetical protein